MANLRDEWPTERSRRPSSADGHESESALPRKMFAEFVGTYFVVIAAAGVEVAATFDPASIDRTVKAFGPALIVVGMIYALGDVSGAHFNPVVTAVFALRRSLPARLLPLYWASQLTGALAAAGTIRALAGNVGDVGVNRLDIVTSEWRAAIVEAALTAAVVIVTLNVAHKHSLIGTESALAVAATFGACRLIGGELTSASMNPARALGPAIVAADFGQLWVFVVGPLAGGIIALAAMVALRPHRNPDEFDAAQGRGAATS